MTPFEIILEEYPPRNKVKTDSRKSTTSYLIAVYDEHLLSSEDHTHLIVIGIDPEERERLHAFFVRWNIERTITHTERSIFQHVTSRAPITIIDLADPESITWLEQHVFKQGTK